MDIVQAEESNITGIAELWLEFMDHHKYFDPRFPMRKDARLHFEEHIKELMASEDNLVLVALDNDKVVGFSTSRIVNYPPVWERETHGTIDSMAVKSEYRRRGIGEEMLMTIMNWFDSNGIDMIELSVAAGNQVGYGFWKKHGFKAWSHSLYLDRNS